MLRDKIEGLQPTTMDDIECSHDELRRSKRKKKKRFLLEMIFILI